MASVCVSRPVPPLPIYPSSFLMSNTVLPWAPRRRHWLKDSLKPRARVAACLPGPSFYCAVNLRPRCTAASLPSVTTSLRFFCFFFPVPPDILDYPTSTDMVVRELSNATLRCVANGSPQPNIIWKREGGAPLFLPSGKEGEAGHAATPPPPPRLRLTRSPHHAIRRIPPPGHSAPPLPPLPPLPRRPGHCRHRHTAGQCEPDLASPRPGETSAVSHSPAAPPCSALSAVASPSAPWKWAAPWRGRCGAGWGGAR